VIRVKDPYEIAIVGNTYKSLDSSIRS